MEKLYILEGTKRRAASKVKCSQCGKQFLKQDRFIRKTVERNQNHFCSRECAYKGREIKIEVVCAYCGKKISRQPSELKRSKSGLYFCNRDCKNSAQTFYNNDNSIVDIQPSHYGKSCGKREYRRHALREHGEVCNRCGYSANIAALTVHHKDRNHDNSNIDNLEVLCANCHCIEHYGE